jgi:hypothetical protein
MTERENFYKWIESCPQNELDAIAECYGFDSNLNRERAIGCMHEALRRFGRPKPPSLKDQALALLKAMQNRINLLHTVYPNIPHGWVADQIEFDCLYRALETLDD